MIDGMTISFSRLRRAGLAAVAVAALGGALLAASAAPASAASGVRVSFTNSGCRTATLTWASPQGPVSYGTLAPGATRTLTSYPTHRWLVDVGTMRVGSFTVGTAPATRRFDSFGCVTSTGQRVVAHSGKCLNVPGWSTTAGTRLIQFRCGTGQDNERFRAITAPGGVMWQNVGSGLCVTVPGASQVADTVVRQQPCSYMRRQILAPRGDGSLAFRHSGQCLDVRGGSADDHTPLVQWWCNGQPNQRWSTR